jgi:hypothetical protein
LNKLFRPLFLVHFAFVAITVSHLYELLNCNPLSSLINLYSSYTYTNRNFGFFAPTVNDDYELSLRAYKKQDPFGHEVVIHAADTENRIRFLTMLWHFSEGNSKSQMDLFARSWGLYCMNTDSTVNQVVISVYKHLVPSMAAYSKGERISKILYYQTTIYAK